MSEAEGEAEGAPKRSLAAVLRHPSLRLFLVGQFLSHIGTWCQRITMGWLAYDLTGSALWVGIIAACEVVPSIAISPLAGTALDSHNRARIFGVGQIAAAMQAALLALLAFGNLLSLGALIPMAVLLGLIDGFNQPSRLTFISEVSPRPLLRAAISVNSIGFNLARFLGPVLGGAALTFGGPEAAFTINALSFIPVMILLLRLPKTAVAVPPNRLEAGAIIGVRYAFSHPLIGILLLQLILLSLFARSFVELLPAISATWFGTSPEALARLTSSVGFGAILGGFVMLALRDMRSVKRALIVLPGLQAAAVCSFAAIAPGTLWSYGALMFLGFCTITIGVSMQNIIHISVADSFRGRVMALYGLIQRSLSAVGAVLIGLLADLVTLHTALILSGATALLCWLLLLSRTQKALRAARP